MHPDKHFDFATLGRRKWVRCYSARCTKRLDRAGAMLLLLFGVILGFASGRAIGCENDGAHLFAGIAAHAIAWDAPDYTTPNPIGLVEARYTHGRYEAALSHRSSLQGFPAVFDSPDEDGYGVNMLEFRMRLF